MTASGLLGVGPHGVGTPTNASYIARSNVYLLPTGQQTGSRELSLGQNTTGQYVFDSTGNRAGMADVSHLIILALRTELGSAADKTLGQRFNETAKITDGFQQEQTQRVNEALGGIVSKQLFELTSVVVEPRMGHPSATHITGTDLTTLNPVDLSLS